MRFADVEVPSPWESLALYSFVSEEAQSNEEMLILELGPLVTTEGQKGRVIRAEGLALAAPLPAAIIADILGIPEGHRSQMLERGDSGAPLFDIGVPWKTFDRGMHMLHASSEVINA